MAKTSIDFSGFGPSRTRRFWERQAILSPNDINRRQTSRKKAWALAETTRSYLLIAMTLLALLGFGVLAIQSGAIDTLNASGFLGQRQ